MVKGTNVTLLAFKHCIYVKHNEESAPEYEIAIDYYTDIADDHRLYGLDMFLILSSNDNVVLVK